MELKNIRHIHFVGIKGVAMTALAVWAQEAGYRVTGSDIQEVFPTDSVLKEAGIVVYDGFTEDHITKLNTHDKQSILVIYTGAHQGKENVEVLTAVELGIIALPHGQALGIITQDKRVIAVAGCHGKTTTTAMIATILKASGVDASYCIGSGFIRGLGKSGHAGTSDWFVVEADEYATDPLHDKTPRFLWLKPEIAVITSIDFDHPDIYTSIEEIGAAYQKFVQNIHAEGTLVLNKNDKNTAKYIHPLSIKNVYVDSSQISSHQLKVPGLHNRSNAAAANAVCKIVGLTDEQIKIGLSLFQGAARRFEILRESEQGIYIDDYAHHPTEITATLAAVREYSGKQKIIAVFQPHTFSRTQELLHDFIGAFNDADVVIITGIYASAREKRQSITAHDIVAQMKHKNVFSAETKNDVFNCLDNIHQPGDTVVFMGAGSIGNWAKDYLATIK